MLKSGNTEQATRLAELTNQLTLAQVQAKGMENSVLAIGDAFGTMMTSGVASLVAGTASAKEVFAQFLNTVSQALLKAAADMIATYIAIGIARIFAGLGSAGSSGTVTADFMNTEALKGLTPAAKGATFSNGIAKFARGGIVGSPTLFKFADGGTTRTGLMGEAGPEAIMPLKRGADGKLGVQANLDGAMSRYRRSPGSADSSSDGGGSEAGGASAGGPMAIDVRYSVERINDVEYVTSSQFQAGLRQAAQQGAVQGEQRTLRRLQQSPSTRKRVGV
jgi:phage-related minor tail protein